MACLSVGNLGTPAPMDERQAAELAYEALVRAAVSSTTAASATDAALMATLRFNLRSTTNIGLDAPPGCVPCASSPRWLLEHRPFFDLDPAHLYGGVLLVLAAFRRATPLSAAFGLRPRRLPALMWVRVRRWLQQHHFLLGS